MRPSLFGLVLLTVLTPAAHAQEVITLESGLGPVGTSDPNVTMLVGPLDGAFPAAFTLNDFLMAQTGPPAEITPLAGGWALNLPGNVTSQWIGTTQVQANLATALYAINFNVTTPNIVLALLDVSFYVDDVLGDANNEGLFINTFPVPNTSPPLAGAYFTPNTFTQRDITPSILAGQNTLYVYGRDNAGPGGLHFSATVTIFSTASLQLGVPFTIGGIGMVIVNGGLGHAGDPWLLAPAITPPFPPGTGIPLFGGNWFRLDLADPILNLAFNSPIAATWFPQLTGTISPVNGLGTSVVNVPGNPSLIGLPMWWQAVMLQPQLEATNVLAVTLL